MTLCLQQYLQNATLLGQSEDTVGKLRLWGTFQEIFQLLETKNDKNIVHRKLHFISGSQMEKLDIGVCELNKNGFYFYWFLNTKYQGCQHRYKVKNVLKFFCCLNIL